LVTTFSACGNGVTHYTTHGMLLKERGELTFLYSTKQASINEKAFNWGAKLVAAQ
jgi:hypothetical protein